MACSADSESEKTDTAIGGWHRSLKKFNAIRMATNSAVNIDTWGSWYFLVRLLSCGTSNAAPTPSVVKDPSVYTQTQWLYLLLINSLAVACKIRGLSDFRSPATSNSTRAPSTTQGGYGWIGLRAAPCPSTPAARTQSRVKSRKGTQNRAVAGPPKSPNTSTPAELSVVCDRNWYLEQINCKYNFAGSMPVGQVPGCGPRKAQDHLNGPALGPLYGGDQGGRHVVTGL